MACQSNQYWTLLEIAAWIFVASSAVNWAIKSWGNIEGGAGVGGVGAVGEVIVHEEPFQAAVWPLMFRQ
jgi:hypothetical protein